MLSSPAVTKQLIYVGSSDGRLYALERASGEIAWRYLVGEQVRVWTSPAVVDDVIYFGAHDGHIYALESSDGK